MEFRLSGKALAGVACAVLVLGGQAEVTAAPAPAAACDPRNLSARGDLDNDGVSDAVVGVPDLDEESGVVDIRYTANPSRVLTAHAMGAGTGESDEFGAAIAVGDLDQDGCADLVIGSPGEAQSAASDGEGGNEGQVHIVFGAPGGIDVGTRITLPHDSSAFDRFGAALALSTRSDGGKLVHDLYVGAPYAEVSGNHSAGEVFHFVITPGGDRRVTATLGSVRDQDSAGVPGDAEVGDGFGLELSPVDNGGVLVGAPWEDVGLVHDAGAVWFLRVSAAGAPIASQSWSQDSPGVPGTPEADDLFGGAIGSRGGTAVVGVHGEDVGSLRDAGAIQVFHQNPGTGAFAPGVSINQDTAGVPGAVEAGDRFGSTVAVGIALLCPESIDVAVGAPREDLGTRPDAGSVTLIGLSGLNCPARSLSQGSGLAGGAEADDRVGWVLGLTRGRTDLDEDYADRLLLGVPFEDLGGDANAGMVQPARGGIVANGVLSRNLQFSAGHRNADHYGMVLSSPAG